MVQGLVNFKRMWTFLIWPNLKIYVQNTKFNPLHRNEVQYAMHILLYLVAAVYSSRTSLTDRKQIADHEYQQVLNLNSENNNDKTLHNFTGKQQRDKKKLKKQTSSEKTTNSTVLN